MRYPDVALNRSAVDASLARALFGVKLDDAAWALSRATPPEIHARALEATRAPPSTWNGAFGLGGIDGLQAGASDDVSRARDHRHPSAQLRATARLG